MVVGHLASASVAVILATAVPFVADSEDSESRLLVSERTSGSSFDIGAVYDLLKDADRSSIDRHDASSEPEPVTESVRAAICLDGWSRQDLTGQCPEGREVVAECLIGEPINPLFTRTMQDDGTWSSWIATSYYTCPQDDELVEQLEDEWATLTPINPEVMMPPSGTELWTHYPVPGWVKADTHTHHTVLIGANITIRATPSEFRWDWGDGTVDTTTQQGDLYPNHAVLHHYDWGTHEATVTVTTTWQGEWRIGQSQWRPFTTTLDTVAEPLDYTVERRTAKLYDCDLNGNCDSDHGF